jgi:hypothetical protein
MSAATWPPPNVRRGFRRLYLILAVPWLVVNAIAFTIAIDDYVHANADFNRLKPKYDAIAARSKPDDPISDELRPISDDLHDALDRRLDAEDRSSMYSVRGIGLPLLIFLIWRALIWIGSGFRKDEVA